LKFLAMAAQADLLFPQQPSDRRRTGAAAKLVRQPPQP
jgi:hypothetical protein